ncbi:MAG: HAD family hydrolase [Desulfobacterales bacterium]|nr:HAD family hydrolase [Desulfobacterales bacterium]
MLEAVFLDLDNTLVLYDEVEYYHDYFEKIHCSFADVFELADFKDRLISGTLALGKSQGERSNKEQFLAVFARGHLDQQANLWQRFMDFYRDGYSAMTVNISVPAGLHAGLQRLRQTGLKLAIASNPIFPVLAQQVRMRWAGLQSEGFDLFTSIENMRYVKPRRAYFLQTCELIGVEPKNCLMVGNDPVNDMSAARAGLKTYRTTDAEVVDYASLTLTEEQRKKGPGDIPEPDFEGPFAGVADVVERLLAEKL